MADERPQRLHEMTVTREVRTFATLWGATNVLMLSGTAELDQKRCIAIGVLTAFALEAYLNHAGALVVSLWPRIERKLGPAEKLDLLDEVLAVKVDRGRPPFQLFDEVFRFRNALAHGKTEIVARQVAQSSSPSVISTDLARASWEQNATPELVRKRLDAAKAMIEVLHSAVRLTPRGRQEPVDAFEVTASGTARGTISPGP